MDNLHLFELINAGPGLDGAGLWAAVVLAKVLVYLMPVAFIAAWVRADHAGRLELLQVLLATLVALGIAEVLVLTWSHPRPLSLYPGDRYPDHASDSAVPSDAVTVFWTFALASAFTHRYARWCFAMLAVGLMVGWSQVYLGMYFPFDVLVCFPVALATAGLAHGLRHFAMPAFARVLDFSARLERTMRAGWSKSHKS